MQHLPQTRRYYGIILLIFAAEPPKASVEAKKGTAPGLTLSAFMSDHWDQRRPSGVPAAF